MKKLRIASLMAVFVFLVISASAQKKYTLRVNPDSGKKNITKSCDDNGY